MEKIKKFKDTNYKKLIIKVVSVFLLVGIILVGTTYAIYQTEDEVLFINARVGKFVANDIELTMKLDGNNIESPPSKDNYKVEVNCDKADGTWDMKEWGPNIRNITSSKVKCEVNFVTPEATLTEVTATSTYNSIDLSYTAGGIGTITTCKYGTEEGSYENEVEGVTNSKCSITGLEENTTYYYQVCGSNSGGENCKIGSVKTFMQISSVNIGDYIRMTPTATSYTIVTSVTGYGSSQTINPSELNLWRVIKKNEDRTIDVVSEYVSSISVAFYGKAGYMNLVGGLNTIAAQYTDGVHVLRTRHIGYSNQLEKCTTLSVSACPSDTGYKFDTELLKSSLGSLKAKRFGTTTDEWYWLASRDIDIKTSSGSNYEGYHTRFVAGNSLSTYYLYSLQNNSGKASFSVRPIVTLNSSTEISSGNGTDSSPYVLN